MAPMRECLCECTGNCDTTLVKKLGAADPGTISGGSFSATDEKNARPHIIGVLRGVRIFLYIEHTDYITDSENSSWCCSSDSTPDSTLENIEDNPGP